jgi:hypothetical protein
MNTDVVPKAFAGSHDHVENVAVENLATYNIYRGQSAVYV